MTQTLRDADLVTDVVDDEVKAGVLRVDLKARLDHALIVRIGIWPPVRGEKSCPTSRYKLHQKG